MRTRSVITIPLTALLLAACGGDGDAAQEAVPGLVIGGDDASASGTSLYQMPTPNELFSLVRDMAGEGHRRMLNPAANADRYVSRRARAVNFGIYSTDLVYASYFKLNVEVARYYLTTKKLAESLGIANAFTDADFIRLESNLTRGDSLEVISNQAYMRAYERLQDEDMGAVLAMVLAGGWVESMHLVIRQIEAFGSNESLMARVAEQKVTLEHLLFMMAPHLDDREVAALHAELGAIQAIYDGIGEVRSAPQGPSASGRMVLGEDVRLDLSTEQYQELVRAVDTMRGEMTRPEGGDNA